MKREKGTCRLLFQQILIIFLPQIIRFMLQRMQDPFRCIRHSFFQVPEELIHLRASCLSVCRARGFYNRKRQDMIHMPYMILRKVYQRPDHRNSRSAQLCLRMKGMEPAFLKKRHEQRINHILPMMAERKFSASKFHTGIG